MQNTTEKLKHELHLLLEQGIVIYEEWAPKEEFQDITKLRSRYQNWYTRSLAVIAQLLPDRLSEFRNLYRLEKPPKQLDAGTYTISDYLEGLTQRYTVQHHHNVFLSKLSIQMTILGSSISRIDSILADTKGALRADLLSTEIGRARELAKNGYLRAAGIIAGVVLENHLAAACSNHQIKIVKARPTLADYNESLKKASVYEITDWQRIQWLASIRNICAQAGQKDPTNDQIESLIVGVDQVIKLIH